MGEQHANGWRVSRHRLVADATVGVIANPMSGRDIRRLVASASVFPNAEKASMVQNASEEPIWDVVVNTPILVEKYKGSAELKFAEAEDEIISVGPHETRKSEITIMTLPHNRLPLRVEFRDNAGRDWSRDDRGRLHQ